MLYVGYGRLELVYIHSKKGLTLQREVRILLATRFPSNMRVSFSSKDQVIILIMKSILHYQNMAIIIQKKGVKTQIISVLTGVHIFGSVRIS